MTAQRHPLVTRAFLVAGLLLLSACASQNLMHAPPPQLRFHGPVVEVPDADTLGLSPAMRRFVERYVMDYQNRQTRLYLLMVAISDAGVLDFHYNDRLTYTAAEAFDKRAGNCIGFANMLVALARAAGLEAWFQEVTMQPELSSHEDTLLVAKHINVIVEGPHNAWVIDVSGQKIRAESRRREMTDSEAQGLYYNNLGAEFLLDGDLARAHAYIAKAIETDAGLPDAWSNLGVVLVRNGQFEDAERAYRTAMQIDSHENAARANLYDLYVLQEKTEEAQELEREVERYRQQNPYYLLLLSEEAIQQQQFDESKRLLRRAIRQKEGEHLLHFAMARVQYLSGEKEAAEFSLARARELAPPEALADYDRPLRELVELAAQEELQ